ncbi:hypothetical protein M3201_11875 [Paenibacillus motobuensis]|nr:hypothetical protein [Paenibacillus lutimineralis]MCM3647501.1 hypothetical protein [Paenibacillus motobuensis]
MKNKVLNFYVEELRAPVIVFKDMKVLYITYRTLGYLLILSILLLPISLFFWAYTPIPTYIVIALLVSLLILFCIFHRIINEKAYDFVRKNLNVKNIKRGNWRLGFDEYQVGKMIAFLEKNKLYCRWKIEKMIEQYQKEIRKNLLSPLITPSILITLLTPNLNQLYSYIYGANVELSWKVTTFIIIFGITLILIMLLNLFSWMKKEIIDDFFNPKNSRIENLISLLEEVLLTIQTEKNDRDLKLEI